MQTLFKSSRAGETNGLSLEVTFHLQHILGTSQLQTLSNFLEDTLLT